MCGARLVDAASASCLPGPRRCAHSAVLGWATKPATGTHQLGPSAEATPRRRRGGDDSSRRRRHGGVPSTWHWGALPLPSLAAGHQQRPKKAHGDGVGRRPKTPRDGVGERSPAPATAAAALWFQSQRQRQWHCCGARETAQALQHGCGEDCWRSASLHCATRATASAALSAVANASSTSLAYKACV